jgi:hypothetical protein
VLEDEQHSAADYERLRRSLAGHLGGAARPLDRIALSELFSAAGFTSAEFEIDLLGLDEEILERKLAELGTDLPLIVQIIELHGRS